MKNVIVGYGDQIVLDNNIDGALAKLFNYEDKTGNETNSTSDKVDGKKIKELYDKAIEVKKKMETGLNMVNISIH